MAAKQVKYFQDARRLAMTSSCVSRFEYGLPHMQDEAAARVEAILFGATV
jgi:hypothetical protein